jgi:hypothetical protein
MTKEHAISPELIAAIKEIIENEAGIDYAELLNAYEKDPSYQEYREGEELTEADFIADILEDGENELGEKASFEDKAMTGALIRATSLGLM